LAVDGVDVSLTTARDVMTPGIHCCREDDDLAERFGTWGAEGAPVTR
jgi:hypothetical protein